MSSKYTALKRAEKHTEGCQLCINHQQQNPKFSYREQAKTACESNTKGPKGASHKLQEAQWSVTSQAKQGCFGALVSNSVT